MGFVDICGTKYPLNQSFVWICSIATCANIYDGLVFKLTNGQGTDNLVHQFKNPTKKKKKKPPNRNREFHPPGFVMVSFFNNGIILIFKFHINFFYNLIKFYLYINFIHTVSL